MGRKCPSCGTDETILWLRGIAAGRSRMLYHCEHCVILVQSSLRQLILEESTASRYQELITIASS